MSSSAPGVKHHREPVRTAADVRHLVAAEVEQLGSQADLDPIRRGRVVAELARVALRAIQLADLDQRLLAIEMALNLRKDTPTKEGKK